MWILHLLPAAFILWIVNTLIVVGLLGIILGFFIKFIPIVNTYRTPIQICSIIIFCIGIYWQGGYSVERSWRERVAELEKKVQEAEIKSAKVNTVVKTKVITKIKLIKEVTNANNQYIKEVVAKDLDAQCKLTNASVMLHNSASQNEVPRSPVNTNGGTSEVKASELLETVNENYGTYYQVVEKLKGWQEWYREQKKIFEAVSN